MSDYGILPERGICWLGRFMHPPCHRDRLTVVLQSFLDASGTNAVGPIVVVAGFVGTESDWKFFESAWRNFLDEFGLTKQRFHSAEYWSRRGNPYNTWTNDKWQNAQVAICKAISSTRLIGTGIAIDINLFKEWRLRLDQFYPNDPYYFCLDRVLYQLITGTSEVSKDEGIVIYIDRDQEYEKIGNAIAQWHIDRLRFVPSVGANDIASDRQVDVHYGSSFNFAPLQLADILSHASFQLLRNKLHNISDPVQAQVFIDAMREAHYRLGVGTYDSLTQLQMDLRSRFKKDESNQNEL